MQKITFYIVCFVSLLVACEKKEIALEPHKPGNMQVVEIPIGYPYNNQVYYHCGTNKIVRIHKKYDWDLSFDCRPDKFIIRLNTAKGVLVARTNSTRFDSTFTVTNAVWQWDKSDGNEQETGIGSWLNSANLPSHEVFIVNRQFNENGNFLGYKKIVFTGFTNNHYTFRYADLNGANEKTFEIEKNASYNRVFFSFDEGGKQAQIEPPKNEWDLLFTNYQHKFSNLELPFVITGCLINADQQVQTVKDSTGSFYTLTLKDAEKYTYSSAWDEIGYDWKIRNSQDNSFTIEPRYYYVVKGTDKKYYKIKFIDFYNKMGEKGYPTFEIQAL